MSAGNAACLHSWLCDFAEYSDVPVTLDGDEVTIHHSQYAKYPLERAARAIHDHLTFDPSDYDDYDGFRDDYFEYVGDEAKEAVEGTPGLTVGLHDQKHFRTGEYINETDLSGAATDLVTLYDGFEPAEDADHHYERYGEGRQVPETKAQLVADLLTVYHVNLAEELIADRRFCLFDEDWTKEEADYGLFALRDLIERQHGWSVFDAPDPSMATVEELWLIMEEIGFEPAVRWTYALFVLPHGAKRYTPDDASFREARAGLDRAFAKGMGATVDDMRYAAEDTTREELEEHQELMRERWDERLEERATED